MSQPTTYQPNATLDLIFERIVDVPKERIWEAWTNPQLITQWFTPAPWQTVACEIDLRPGGTFYTLMRSPEGQEYPNIGCYLEIIENKKLIWTNTLLPGFRPAPAPDDLSGFQFTGIIALESHPQGTKYTATVIHGDEKSCRRHNEMGFHEGWSLALDQLVAMVNNKK
ncbi:MAG: SRPBCC family protein [Pseudomonadota bacterium]